MIRGQTRGSKLKKESVKESQKEVQNFLWRPGVWRFRVEPRPKGKGGE